MTKNEPTDWGSGPLGGFIRQANDNSANFFIHQPNNAKRLADIDAMFVRAIDLLQNSLELLPNFLLFRAHAIFRTAVRLFTSGQHYESYVLLRACLETGLYALHAAKNSADVELWLNREESTEFRARMKRAYRLRGLLTELQQIDGDLYRKVADLYELTIDLGGHPNPRGVLSMAEWKRDEAGISYNAVYLSNDPILMGASFMSAARVAIVTLSVFRHVHRERFEIMGLTQEIARISSRLF